MPISSATLDSSGQVVFADLSPPAAAVLLAHTADQSSFVLEATDISHSAFVVAGPTADPLADLIADQSTQTDITADAAHRSDHGTTANVTSFYETDNPTAPMPVSIPERTTTGQFTEAGIVQVLAHTAEPDASASRMAEAAVSNTAAQALPPSSVTYAEQNLSVQDTPAATDASASTKPSATPDAATPSHADAITIAAPTANLAAPAATIADIDAQTAPIAAGLAELKGLLLKLVTPTPASSAHDRSPDTDPERDE